MSLKVLRHGSVSEISAQFRMQKKGIFNSIAKYEVQLSFVLCGEILWMSEIYARNFFTLPITWISIRKTEIDAEEQ